jgi:hypothetical protein
MRQVLSTATVRNRAPRRITRYGPSGGTGVVHQLHVEGVGAHVDDRIGVERLRLALLGSAHVDVLVIGSRLGTDEALDRAGHGRQPEHGTERRRRGCTSASGVP